MISASGSNKEGGMQKKVDHKSWGGGSVAAD